MPPSKNLRGVWRIILRRARISRFRRLRLGEWFDAGGNRAFQQLNDRWAFRAFGRLDRSYTAYRVSHAFSYEPGGERLTPEETRELLAYLQGRTAATDGKLSVAEIAQALDVPVWQVQDAVKRMRTGQKVKVPLPASDWLKKRLWVWALGALLALGICGQIFESVFTPRSAPPVAISRGTADFPYSSLAVEIGERHHLRAPDGFSYLISAGGTRAAVYGPSASERPAASLSQTNSDLLKDRLAEDIVRGFDNLVRTSQPSEWIDGRMIASMELNNYPGGWPIVVDLTLDKNAFPYSESNSHSRILKDQVRRMIYEHWDEFTSVEQ